MAEITKELGRIPVSRGDYQATTEYYKDNIVQYKRGSYQVVSESPIIGVPPTNDKNVVNPGWTLFAGTLDAQDIVNQIKEQEAKSIQAVAAREAEILAKSDAAGVSFDNTGTSLRGTNVQDTLKEMDSNINQLKNAGYLYAGIATPTTNPGTPEGPVFYIANGKGTYTNFGGINVTEDDVVILYYDTVWHKNTTGIASQDKLTELDSKVKDISRDEIQNTEDKIAIQDANGNDIVTVTEDGLNAKSLKVNNVRVLTQDDNKEIEHYEEEGFTDEEIEVQDSLGNTVVKITPDGADFKSIKKKGVEIQTLPAIVEETYKKDEEIVFGDSEENPIMKISRGGVKVSSITDMEGNQLVPTYEHHCNITDDIYVVVNRELCIYADAVINSQDRGLSSPINYRVVFNCNIGEVHDRLYRLVPTESQVGNYNFRIRVFNINNEVVIDKTSTLHVINSNGFSSLKNILFVGASITEGIVTQLHSHFSEMAGVQPNFIGSNRLKEGVYDEAYGGWRYYDFDSVGRPAYRCQVSGITTIMINDVYTDGTNNFVVQETNINGDGSGNISLKFITGVMTIPQTLTKVSGIGDSSIAIDSYTIEGNNKLWNINTNQLDIANYRQTIGLSGNIDIVVFELGVNDANYEMPIDSVKVNIEHLYSAFVSDNPNCKVVVTIEPTWCNTISGTRTNGGAAFDIEHAKPYHWGYIKMFFEHFVNNPNFPNMRVAFIGGQIDRFYGYNRWEWTTSKYVTEKISEHENLYHPNDVGYKQLAEAFISELIALYN